MKSAICSNSSQRHQNLWTPLTEKPLPGRRKSRVTLPIVLLCGSIVAFLGSTVSRAQPERPFIPLPEPEKGSAAFSRFKDWVDKADTGNPGYRFSATDAAILYRITGKERYARLAISMVDNEVREAEAAIAKGQRPRIAGDSYLRVGGRIKALSLTFDSAYDLLTPDQRRRWSSYAQQTVWNVWNHRQAHWGDAPHPWTGWGSDNPGNNYHFSFVTATLYWALASQDSSWMEMLKQDKMPAIVEYYLGLEGGGSREGTGYGAAQSELFAIYRLWRDTTGEDIAASLPHVGQTIDYWIHATLPTLDRLAPIGDQARVSHAPLYDSHERLILEAVDLMAGSEVAARGTWWLKNNSVVQMRHGFNLKYMMLRRPHRESIPASLLYYSEGTGHLFARTSWKKNAIWLSFVAGPFVESHAAQDQGSFSLFHRKWLVVTENIHTHSGIRQETDVQNGVRFVKEGKTIPQRRGTRSRLSFTDEDGVLEIHADMSAAYGLGPELTWTRDLRFDRNTSKVRIHDRVTVPAGVEPIWQINTPSEPTIKPSGIAADGLEIRPLLPARPSVSLLDWKTVDAREYRGGWRVELKGGNEYLVELTVE